MSDDYSRATDSAPTVEIAGKDWHVSKLTPRDMGDLQAYLKEVIPSPRSQFRELAEGMSDEVAKAIWADLNAEHGSWPPAFGSPAFNREVFYTREGNARLLHVVLRRHNRGVDLERARELAESVDMELFDKIVGLCLPEYARDPKAPTMTEGPPGTG